MEGQREQTLIRRHTWCSAMIKAWSCCSIRASADYTLPAFCI